MAKKGCSQGITWRSSETGLALPLSCAGTRDRPTAFAWWMEKTWSFLQDAADTRRRARKGLEEFGGTRCPLKAANWAGTSVPRRKWLPACIKNHTNGCQPAGPLVCVCVGGGNRLLGKKKRTLKMFLKAGKKLGNFKTTWRSLGFSKVPRREGLGRPPRFLPTCVNPVFPEKSPSPVGSPETGGPHGQRM